jgi:long-chain acyl-CoA synthetase
MARNSLGELVARFEQLGSETAYAFRRGLRMQRWSYGELTSCAQRFAHELAARGVAPGERVLIWAPNCAEWVAAFFGCVLRGAVVVPMDVTAARDFAIRVAHEVDAKLVVGSRQQSLPGIPHIAVEDLASSVAKHPSQFEPYASKRSDTLEIIFTSGTTSDPRGVVITHGNVLANLEPLEAQIAKYLHYEKWFHPLRLLDLLPLSHVFGQFLGIFVPQSMGATVVFHDTLNPGEILRLIKRERVSACICVPRMLQSLRQQVETIMGERGALQALHENIARSENEKFVRRWWRFRKVHDLFGWKFWAFICGGAALDEATEQFWARLAFAVVQGYGLTETTSLISVNHPFHVGRRSIGKVLPGREMKLASDGEILVRGENIASAYWQGSAKQAVAEDEGWFHTGDLGEIDADGNLYFKGRKKNVIVTAAGMNVYPEDLESALRSQLGVRDAVVVGVPVAGDMEPCAVLLVSADAQPEQVIREANTQLAEHQRLRQWRVWPESDFPRTPTQKPRLPEIERFARGAAQPSGGASVLASVIARIKGKNGEPLAPDASLDALNLTSMDRVELLSALEDRYQIDLSEREFTAATTVADLERQLRSKVANAPQMVYPRWPLHPLMRAVRTAVYYALTWPATRLMARPTVVGAEHLRDLRGPILIVSNHVTYIDVGFILFALPPHLRSHLAVAMRGELLMEMRRPSATMNWFHKQIERLSYLLVIGLFNVFPLPNGAGFRQSFEFAGSAADQGNSILIFPEGRRTTDGQVASFQAGAGILANRLNVPVVPMRIDGLWEPAQRNRHFLRNREVIVRVGAPVRYRPDENPNSIAHDLERRVREL